MAEVMHRANTSERFQPVAQRLQLAEHLDGAKCRRRVENLPGHPARFLRAPLNDQDRREDQLRQGAAAYPIRRPEPNDLLHLHPGGAEVPDPVQTSGCVDSQGGIVITADPRRGALHRRTAENTFSPSKNGEACRGVVGGGVASRLQREQARFKTGMTVGKS